MGLDIRVYKGIKELDGIPATDHFDFIAYVIDDKWLRKIKNLTTDGYYIGTIANRGVSYSYSTHSRFREELIRLIGRDDLLDDDGKIKWSLLEKEKGMPFYELINFADNEGCMDWECSGIIYKNFKDWETVANDLFDGSLNKQYYKEWMKSFKVAKDNGVLVFS